MVHLLDANVLINANRLYYPLQRVPEFWEWLEYQGALGNVKVPLEIAEEIRDGQDDLAEWLSQRTCLDAMLMQTETDVEHIQRVLQEGYAPDLTDQELEIIGKDPFLIAAALSDPVGHCVVSAEVSRPSTQRQNRKVPDVCRQFSIRCIDGFALVRELDFTTSWKATAGVFG